MYRRVAASDDAELVPLALRNLAVAQYKQGLLGEAKETYRAVLATGDATQVPIAARALGVIFEQEGDAKEAERAHRFAIEADTGDVNLGEGVVVQFDLAGLLEQEGRVDEAERVLREVVDSGHRELKKEALYRLGYLTARQGRLSDAEAVYFELEKLATDPEDSTRARLARASLLAQLGRWDEAEMMFRYVLSASDGTIAATAALTLGSMLYCTDEAEEAEALVRRALEADDPSITGVAALTLGSQLSSEETLLESESLLRRAAASEVSAISSRGSLALAQLLKEQGRFPEAREAAISAIELAANEEPPVDLQTLMLVGSSEEIARLAREILAELVIGDEGRASDLED